MRINELPLEILEEILSYLTVKEKFRCERVCHLWQDTVFKSIDTLTFEKFDDVFYRQHKCVTSKENILSSEVNNDDDVMKTIISKCGKNLRSFRGFVSHAAVHIIVQFCKRINSIDMLFNDAESLKCIGEAYGKQLVCVTLYDNMIFGIPNFIASCSNLSFLAVISSRPMGRQISYDNLNSALELFNHTVETPKLPESLASLRNLVVRVRRNFTEETLSQLMHFNTLEAASVLLDHHLNMSQLWKSVLIKWSNLKYLSIEVVSDECIHFNPLPSNLENLRLRTHPTSNYEPGTCEKPIKLLHLLPNLRALTVWNIEMKSNNLSSFLESVVCSCPALEELSLKRERVNFHIMDEQLAPLLSLNTLKKLSLEMTFDVTDEFASKLLTELDQLTSFGTCTDYDECSYLGNLLPGGPLFMDSLHRKASERPWENFYFTGEVKGAMYLHEPLPPNVILCLQYAASVHLANGVGRSACWRELVERSCELNSLTLEIEDETNFNLSGFPRSARCLTVGCLNYVQVEDHNLLTFNVCLRKLTHLSVYQNILDNRQLRVIIQSIGRFCPNLLSLCINRGNTDFEPVDEFLTGLMNYKFLSSLCLTERFTISDQFGAKLVNDIETLRCFGCERRHLLGIQCGPLFLDAVALKALIGQRITLNGGPTSSQVLKTLKMNKLPQLLTIVPRQQTVQKQMPCQIA